MSIISLYCAALITLVMCFLFQAVVDYSFFGKLYLHLVGVLTYSRLQLIKPITRQLAGEYLNPYALSSSVWCLSDIDGHRICTFKNLCYVPVERQFIFVISNSSILSGIKDKTELKSLELSSIRNHNQFIMKIAVVSFKNHMLKRQVLFERSPVQIIWRFKRDNIMHVIHDDLLPLYVTYSNICNGNVDKCVSKFRLALMDDVDNHDPFMEWYKLFSNSDPIFMQKQNDMLCFGEIRAGLVRSSIWFQYGFGNPHGPVITPQFSGNIIRQFVSFVAGKFSIPIVTESSEVTLAVFNRRINRKILNENFLLKAINDTYHYIFPSYSNIKIITMDLSVNGTLSVLKTLMQCRLIVGMHGAEMILSIFLSPGAVVVELFPYGIEPKNVSPLRALSQISGVDFYYESWRNTQEKNTLTHPDALPIYGGINHLSKEEQETIKSLIPIPAVECCHNPAYLYRMFQDTLIAPNFVLVLQKGLKRQTYSSGANVNLFLLSQWWFPAPVSNISCKLNPTSLDVYWNASINVEGMKSQYVITVSGNQFFLEHKINETTLKIDIVQLKLFNKKEIDVWVKCVVDTEESLDTHFQCKISSNIL